MRRNRALTKKLATALAGIVLTTVLLSVTGCSNTQKVKIESNQLAVIASANSVDTVSTRAGAFLLGKRSISDSFLNMDNENRKILDKLNNEWVMPKDYTLKNVEYHGLKMNWIYPKGSSAKKVILQLHGGAYRKSLADYPTMYQRTAVEYAKISGARVLTIDYRVAPPNPFPAALNDAVMAYQWLLKNGYTANTIIIAGDSAGGGLTLATALYLRDHKIPMPRALITMSAWTNLNYKRFSVPYVGKSNAANPYISPFYGSYKGFPPMLMQAGGDEVILKDTTSVAEKARKAGVNVTQTTYSGMFHDFQMLFPANNQANKAWAEVEVFLKKIYNKT